jgi:hypothetical protein
VIVAVGSDKGSPGASTLALLLGMCWPGDRLVVELDPRGADLPYRVAGPGGQPVAASPSITTLAVDSRPASPRQPLHIYAQPSAVGVPMIVGETSASRFARITMQLPAIAAALSAWPGTVIADLGCLQPSSPVLPVAAAATVVVLVTRADAASLAHLRDRVEELAADLGGPHRLRSPLAVAVRADRRDAGAAEGRVQRLLASIGSPSLVLGVMPEDPAGVAAACAGALTKRMTRTGLLSQAGRFSARLRATWPELSDPGPTAEPSVPAGGRTVANGSRR